MPCRRDQKVFETECLVALQGYKRYREQLPMSSENASAMASWGSFDAPTKTKTKKTTQ